MEGKLEEYDMETTTSSDFTAIYKIPGSLYQNFKQNIYPVFNEFLYKTKGKSYPIIMAFKTFLIDGITKELADDNDRINSFGGNVLEDPFFQTTKEETKSKVLERQYSTENEVKLAVDEDRTPQNRNMSGAKTELELKRLDSTKSVPVGMNAKRAAFLEKGKSPSTLSEYINRSRDFEIAEINFSFKNREILNLLAERGKAILDNDHEMKILIEQEINAIIKIEHERLTTPVAAFITFANEESYLKATDLNKVRVGSKVYYKKYWQGHPLFFKPALEPSAVLWENQYVPQSEKVWKLIVSLIVIFLVLFASFVFFFYAQKEIYDYMNTYPYIDCTSVLQTYHESLEHYAILEWTYLKNTLHSNDLTSSTGTLSCFCAQYSKQNGVISTLNAQFFTQSKLGEYVGGQVCYDWQSGNTLLSFLDVIITLVIIFTDIILRNVVVILIRWVHFRSLNFEYVTIQVLLFVSQYLNNGLSLMLVGMNLDEAFGSHVIFLDGRYPDFTSRWFNEIANFFITPMYINLFIPFIEFSIVYAAFVITKWHDRGWSSNIYATKCKSIGQYIDIHSGPENDIFDGYSYIMVITWINMFFGVGLPLLFPLSLLSFIINYLFERILQVYWYKKSAMINDRLNKNAIKTCMWAVHLYTFGGYWYLTNRQIFYNDAEPKARRSDMEITNHTIFHIEIDQTFPLLIFSFLLLAYMLFYLVSSFVWSLIKTDTMNIFLRSVEDLYTYYDSLDQHDLKTLILEEENNRSQLGYAKTSDTSFKSYKLSRLKRRRSSRALNQIENEILNDKTIFNTFSYDLLLDTRYIDLYQYVPVIYRDLNQPFKQEYIDSEYVRKCVDLAYWYYTQPEKLEENPIDQRVSVHRRMDYYMKKMTSLSQRSY